MNRHTTTRFASVCLLATLLGGASSLLTGCGGGGGTGGGSGSSSLSNINTGSGSAVGTNNSNTSSSGSSVATRQEPISYGADGTRGYLPVTIEQGAGGVVAYKALDSSAGVVLNAASTTNVQVDAPASYADRSFVKWQRGGQDLSASPSMTFIPAALPGSGALTAVYQTQNATDGAFAPNYTRSGFPSWDHFPVKVYLDSTVAPGSSQAASIAGGMDRWVKASGGVISYTLVTDPSQADITIGFGTTPTGLAGVTSASWDGDDHLVSAAITISPAALTGTPATIQDLNTIAAHEFGHSLGLVSDSDGAAGHSTDPNDTMYPTGNAQIGLISARDINTVATNYVALFGGVETRGVKAHGVTRSAKSPSGPLHHATID